MEKHRGNVCCFCLNPGPKFHQLKDCIAPPIHVRFDGTTELRDVLEKILKNDATQESKDVCVRCNEKFQQIHAFMNSCSKNVSLPVPDTASSSCSIGQSSQLNTLGEKEDHNESFGTKSFKEGSSISMFQKIKKAVVRLKRLKMVTLAVKVKSECDSNFCCTTGYGSAENISECQAKLIDSRIVKCTVTEITKSEILEDIHTEDYQVIEPPNALKTLVQEFSPKEEPTGNANTSHFFSTEQSNTKLDKADSLKRSPIVRKHNQRTSSNKRYKCGRCGKLLSNLFGLKIHQKIHSGKRFECDQCHLCFLTEQHLRLHISLKHEMKKIRQSQKAIKTRFKCDHCEKDFCSSYGLKEHRRLHTGKTVQCDMCDASFTTRNALLQHKSKDHNGRRYKCHQCNSYFGTQQDFRSHVSKKHKIRHKNGRYRCEKCGNDFSRLTNLKDHEQLHAGIMFDCDHCDAKFRTSLYLRRHKREMHTSIKEQLKCDQCNKTFVYFHLLKDHQRLHTGNSLECDQCRKTFGTKQLLNSHKYKMHRNKQYKCDRCRKQFVEVTNLEKHLLTHKNDSLESLECQYCGKKFDKFSKLQRHKEDAHTYLTAYKCEQCEKYFSSASTLKRHMLIHQNVNFPCNLCGKKFSRKTSVLKHWQTMHTGETLNSNPCGQSFIKNDCLQKQLRVCEENIQVPMDEASLESRKKAIVVDQSFNGCKTVNVFSKSAKSEDDLIEVISDDEIVDDIFPEETKSDLSQLLTSGNETFETVIFQNNVKTE